MKKRSFLCTHVLAKMYHSMHKPFEMYNTTKIIGISVIIKGHCQMSACFSVSILNKMEGKSFVSKFNKGGKYGMIWYFILMHVQGEFILWYLSRNGHYGYV